MRYDDLSKETVKKLLFEATNYNKTLKKEYAEGKKLFTQKYPLRLKK